MKTTQNINRFTSIESTIDAIERTLVRNLPADLTVVREKKTRNATWKGMISIYPASLPESKGKRTPLVTYTFYPGTFFTSRLGSVAIYADNVTLILARIHATETLFGIPVIEARLVYGRRPFIDVKLAA